MQSLWDILSQLQIFFQLNFLLTGLELSSTSIFIIRSLVFLTCLIGFVWGFFRIALKILDVAQTLAAALGPLPRSFFLLLFLISPSIRQQHRRKMDRLPSSDVFRGCLDHLHRPHGCNVEIRGRSNAPCDQLFPFQIESS